MLQQETSGIATAEKHISEQNCIQSRVALLFYRKTFSAST